MAWNFIGAANRIDDIDIPRIAETIGVGEDEIHAFMEVESAGSGFDSLKRPKMLFEPHVFYRILGPGRKRDLALVKGLAYPKWGMRPYPSNSYPRLADAIEIDETAALKSASWGLGQILGENHSIVGYKTPQAMVKAFMEDEENHLAAMVQFLISRGIDDDLRNHNWANVARVYNGPSYAVHGYHLRLAKAFAKWQRIRDTPWVSMKGKQGGSSTVTTPDAPATSVVKATAAPAAPVEPAAPFAPEASHVPPPSKTIAGVVMAIIFAIFGIGAAWVSKGN